MLDWFSVETREWINDRYAKKLGFGNTVALFLEAMIHKRKSLESITDHLKSSTWLQQWLELESIHPSSLNRKLALLPTESLRDIYQELAARTLALLGGPRGIQHYGPLAAVDSSTLRIGKVRGTWAHQQAGQNAVKMHTCLYLTGEPSACPAATVLSTAVVADLDEEVVGHLVTDPAYTYLLDRGYIYYKQFLAWNRTGISFAARLKANSQVRIVDKRAGHSHPILLDAEVELVDPATRETGRFRMVEYTYTDEKGRNHRVRVLTNRFDLAAADIADIYRYRWKVELFFKFMKQQLHLKKVFSSKPEAVWNQIYLNLVAYLLCEWHRLTYVPEQTVSELIGKLKHFAHAPWLDFLKVLRPVRLRTSQGRRKKAKLGRPRKYPKKPTGQHLVYY
jgi:hypothetical protein